MANKGELGKNIQKTQTIYYSTVISIALVATMMGLFALIMLETRKLTQHLKENVTLNVVLEENARQSSIDSLIKRLDGHPSIKSFTFISKSAAADSLTKDLGEDFVHFLGQNPLQASIEIHPDPKYSKVSDLNTLKDEISLKAPIVEDIYYEKNLVNSIHRNARLISVIVLTFMLLLTIVAVALINNSIRLIIYSQRLLIRSMQLIGATRSFIRKPYLYYGFIHGLIGGVTAVFFMSLVVYVLSMQLPYISLTSSFPLFALVFGVVFLFAVVLSVISSFFAVNKFLKLKTHELY